MSKSWWFLFLNDKSHTGYRFHRDLLRLWLACILNRDLRIGALYSPGWVCGKHETSSRRFRVLFLHVSWLLAINSTILLTSGLMGTTSMPSSGYPFLSRIFSDILHNTLLDLARSHSLSDAIDVRVSSSVNFCDSPLHTKPFYDAWVCWVCEVWQEFGSLTNSTPSRSWHWSDQHWRVPITLDVWNDWLPWECAPRTDAVCIGDSYFPRSRTSVVTACGTFCTHFLIPLALSGFVPDLGCTSQHTQYATSANSVAHSLRSPWLLGKPVSTPCQRTKRLVLTKTYSCLRRSCPPFVVSSEERLHPFLSSLPLDHLDLWTHLHEQRFLTSFLPWDSWDCHRGQRISNCVVGQGWLFFSFKWQLADLSWLHILLRHWLLPKPRLFPLSDLSSFFVVSLSEAWWLKMRVKRRSHAIYALSWLRRRVCDEISWDTLASNNRTRVV